jgi:membrane protein YdbS with pleckstrin-like domain
MLKNFLFKRPDWFKHEGYWRLAQVFRLGLAAMFLVFAVVSLGAGVVAYRSSGFFELGFVWAVTAVCSVVAVHWLLRLIVWVIEGFRGEVKGGGKAAR